MSLDERIDPVELLSRYSAPDGWDTTVELTGPSADRSAVSLLERILGGRLAPTGPRRRHLRLVTGVIVAASLGGTAVAATAILSRHADETRALSCWSEPVTPPGQQVGLRWDGVADPVDACSNEWNGGGLGTVGPPGALQACVTTDGFATVIPGDATTCERLGLAPMSPPPPNAAGNQPELDVAALERDLVTQINFGPCLTADAARAAVRDRLDAHGLTHWTITLAAPSDAAPACATVAVVSEAESVTIVMIPSDG